MEYIKKEMLIFIIYRYSRRNSKYGTIIKDSFCLEEENMKESILIAEDEDRLREIVREYLEDEDFKVLEAANGREALEIFQSSSIDLALIDIRRVEPLQKAQEGIGRSYNNNHGKV